MNEQGYVDATNLAKLRIAYDIAKDCRAVHPGEHQLQIDILSALARWRDSLEMKVFADLTPTDR